MSTRPDELPRWGTDLSNVTEPNSFQKDTGWTTGQAPSSAVQNWYQEKVYRWLEYQHQCAGAAEVSAVLAGVNVEDTGAGVDLNDAAINPATPRVIVVGDTGTISNLAASAAVTSPTPGSSFTGNLNGVAWDSTHSLWIIVGAGEEIQTASSSGATWTRRHTGILELNSVAVSSTGIVVAVGNGGAIYQSTNGTSYTSRTSATSSDDLIKVLWAFDANGVERCTILNDEGEVQYSTDGVTWTLGLDPTNSGPFALDYHPNWGWVHRQSANIRTSQDGITFTSLASVSALVGGVHGSAPDNRMRALPNGLFFWCESATGTDGVYAYGLSLENTRVLTHTLNLRSAQNYLNLGGRIWILTGDQIHTAGVVA